MRVLKKYYTDGRQDYQGIYILWFDWKIFKFRWFTDCGEWFIYIYFGKYRWIRFSGAGYMSGRVIARIYG